jgi:hypothetical protein
MTRYTVVWVRRVEDRLIEIWLGAQDRNAITAATHQIDTQLAVDPQSKGGELSEGLRYYQAEPLRVAFTVHVDDRTVEIVSVRRV